jgi:hypothetical protein
MSTPVREVDLLEVGQARIGLERHSQLFGTNITDRVAREAVGVWTWIDRKERYVCAKCKFGHISVGFDRRQCSATRKTAGEHVHPVRGQTYER